MADAITDYPVIILHDRIAFSTNIARHDMSFYQIDPQQLFTKYGYLIPLNTSSFEILDYFQDGLDNLFLHERKAKALLVNWRGQVHEISMKRDPETDIPTISRMRILTGQGTRFATATIVAEIEKAQTAMMVRDTLEEVIEIINPCLYNGAGAYQIYDLNYIASRLKRRNECEPFPKVASSVLNIKLKDVDLN
jgi:hypothetical protein